MKQHDLILVAEDDENHVLLLKRAFKQSNCLNPVFYVEDGEQVVAYLEGKGKFSNRSEFPLPSLLLLDLKMPNKNGFEVLAWLRGHPTLSILPVVVLSSSGDTSDIKRAYQLGANTFLTKPVDVRDFVQMCGAIKGYWLWLSQVPELARPDPLPVGPELAPVLDPGALRDTEHLVQFFERDAFLVDSVSAFVGAGLRDGEAAVIIATEAHREAFATRLLRQDDLEVAKLMVDGVPEPTLFRQVLGMVFTRAAQAGRRVRAFSDMAAVLWGEGNVSGAICLEELWNDLGKEISFRLFCGYSLQSFRGESKRLPFLHICKQHSRVVPAESYSSLASADDRLRFVTGLQQKTLSLEPDESDLAEHHEARE